MRALVVWVVGVLGAFVTLKYYSRARGGTNRHPERERSRGILPKVTAATQSNRQFSRWT
jgi:hypothetical protein